MQSVALIKNNKIWILEIASRTIGGDCGQMLNIDDFSVEAVSYIASY